MGEMTGLWDDFGTFACEFSLSRNCEDEVGRDNKKSVLTHKVETTVNS